MCLQVCISERDIPGQSSDVNNNLSHQLMQRTGNHSPVFSYQKPFMYTRKEILHRTSLLFLNAFLSYISIICQPLCKIIQGETRKEELQQITYLDENSAQK